MKRLKRVRALFGFLRQHRRELFDDEFQDELEEMYRKTGAGDPPNPPALMCMAMILQGYVGASDAEAVELSVVDLRWQMVLGCLGATEPAFSQGALQAFRERMIANEMGRAVLERTVSLARAGTLSDSEARGVSKGLRVAVDSRPLAGTGRVEDTLNLLGHTARNIVRIVSKIMDQPVERICRRAGIPVLLAPSVKAGLDIDWSDPRQKVKAVEIVERQVSSLQDWVDKHLDDTDERPLLPYIETLQQIREQDIEQNAEGAARIRQGVARDRRISIEDAEMRHGRKSKSKRFDGYKEHIANELGGSSWPARSRRQTVQKRKAHYLSQRTLPTKAWKSKNSISTALTSTVPSSTRSLTPEAPCTPSRGDNVLRAQVSSARRTSNWTSERIQLLVLQAMLSSLSRTAPYTLTLKRAAPVSFEVSAPAQRQAEEERSLLPQTNRDRSDFASCSKHAQAEKNFAREPLSNTLSPTSLRERDHERGTSARARTSMTSGEPP